MEHTINTTAHWGTPGCLHAISRALDSSKTQHTCISVSNTSGLVGKTGRNDPDASQRSCVSRKPERSNNEDFPTDNKAWQRGQSTDEGNEREVWMDQPNYQQHRLRNTSSTDLAPFQKIHPSGETCPHHCPGQCPVSQIRTSITLRMPTLSNPSANNTSYHEMPTWNEKEMARIDKRSNGQSR